MPKEEKDQRDPVAVISGMLVMLIIIVLGLLAILLPGLYVKLWEWVY